MGWDGKAVALAGDEVGLDELRETFERVSGRSLPEVLTLLGRVVLWWVEDARRSFEWFWEAGYGADIVMLREEEAESQGFEMWLRESSRWSVETESSD